MREPDVVGTRMRRVGVRDELPDGRAGASVDARAVALRVKLVRPCAQEALDSAVATPLRAVVSLHIEVDGTADAEPDGARSVDRVVGRPTALGGGVRRGDRREVPLAGARRL